MTDLALAFGGHDFDLVLADNDLARDDGLESAVIVSLFCDARARPEQLPSGDDASDLRGWWGDIDLTRGDGHGSLLWTLFRRKQTDTTLANARAYAQAALAWLVEDRVARSVTVDVEKAAHGVIALSVAIARPDGSRVDYRFDSLWMAQAAKVA
jgi:phage gp46-like protein